MSRGFPVSGSLPWLVFKFHCCATRLDNVSISEHFLLIHSLTVQFDVSLFHWNEKVPGLIVGDHGSALRCRAEETGAFDSDLNVAGFADICRAVLEFEFRLIDNALQHT